MKKVFAYISFLLALIERKLITFSLYYFWFPLLVVFPILFFVELTLLHYFLCSPY